MAFIKGHFHNGYLSHESFKLVWNLSEITLKLPRGQWAEAATHWFPGSLSIRIPAFWEIWLTLAYSAQKTGSFSVQLLMGHIWNYRMKVGHITSLWSESFLWNIYIYLHIFYHSSTPKSQRYLKSFLIEDKDHIYDCLICVTKTWAAKILTYFSPVMAVIG